MQTNKRDQKGEIVTILTVGTVIVLSAITLVSSILLPKNKQTTASRAEDPTTCSNPNKPIDFCIREECDTAISKWVMIEKFCNNEKKIIEKAGAATNRSCNQAGKQCCGGGTTSCTLPAASTSTQTSGGVNGGANGGTSGVTGSGTASNGCYTMKAEFETQPGKNEGKDSVNFYAWVTIDGKPGDVWLHEAGILTGHNGFPGHITYDPKWSQHWRMGEWIAVANIVRGNSYTVNYRALVSSCQPQDLSLSCGLKANADGTGTVDNTSGCICKNCATAAVPTATTAPATTTSPVTTSAPGAPAVTTVPATTTVPGAAVIPAPTQTPCQKKSGFCFNGKTTNELYNIYPFPEKYQKGLGCPSENPYCCYSETIPQDCDVTADMIFTDAFKIKPNTTKCWYSKEYKLLSIFKCDGKGILTIKPCETDKCNADFTACVTPTPIAKTASRVTITPGSTAAPAATTAPYIQPQPPATVTVAPPTPTNRLIMIYDARIPFDVKVMATNNIDFDTIQKKISDKIVADNQLSLWVYEQINCNFIVNVKSIKILTKINPWVVRWTGKAKDITSSFSNSIILSKTTSQSGEFIINSVKGKERTDMLIDNSTLLIEVSATCENNETTVPLIFSSELGGQFSVNENDTTKRLWYSGEKTINLQINEKSYENIINQ